MSKPHLVALHNQLTSHFLLLFTTSARRAPRFRVQGPLRITITWQQTCTSCSLTDVMQCAFSRLGFTLKAFRRTYVTKFGNDVCRRGRRAISLTTIWLSAGRLRSTRTLRCFKLLQVEVGTGIMQFASTSMSRTESFW